MCYLFLSFVTLIIVFTILPIFYHRKSQKMIDKAACSTSIFVLTALTLQNVVCEDIPIIGENVNVAVLETKIDRLEQILFTHENTILEVTKKNEDLQRMAESQAKLLERINASVWSNDKYGCSDTNVVFAANIHLQNEYFLPNDAVVSSYNQIPINVGNHFDGYSGTFEAPHSGAYEFWMDAKIKSHKHAWVDLRVNGETVKIFSTGIRDSGYDTDLFGLDGNAVISLSAYDVVDIFVPKAQGDYERNAICGHSDAYFMFAGRAL